MLLSLASTYAQGEIPKPDPATVSEIQIEGFVEDDIMIGDLMEMPEADTTVHDYTTLQVKPEFPGGSKSLASYFKKNVNTALVTGVKTGTYNVQIYFVVEKDGTLTDIKGIVSPEKSMITEVIRVAKSMRIKFQPGVQNGKPVRSGYPLNVEVIIP